ncbi:MAG: DUF3365 domain-containing protein [Nitrospirae bacterium]|nr:DUF3365 domain-containing protein [Nitrospirota bacterium]
MTYGKLVWGAVALVLVGASSIMLRAAETSGPSVSIPLDMVADYVHAVIQADREIYTKNVVERMQAKGIVVASENWQEKNTLPLPAQFLMDSAHLVARRSNIRYRLLSLWPINARNGPATEFERAGLAAVLTQPDRPYTGFFESGQKWYYQAIYADRAVSQTCVGCHNAHPDSPKRDFRQNDVMGGIMITIPARQ